MSHVCLKPTFHLIIHHDVLHQLQLTHLNPNTITHSHGNPQATTTVLLTLTARTFTYGAQTHKANLASGVPMHSWWHCTHSSKPLTL